MDSRNKKSIRLRILFLTTIFAVISVVCGTAAILFINNFSARLQDADFQNTIYMYFVFFVALIVAAVAFAIYINYSLTTRMQQPLSALEKLAYHLASTGNLQMPEEMAAELTKQKKVSDEIGSTIQSFDTLVKSLLEKVTVLEAVAQGDLRNRVKPSSDEDYLGIAVNAVVTNLSTIVSGVISATDQLTVGANELSIGAQTLSQSSSEQSATMDMLHVTASEIAAEAAENAERAAEASVLTAQIRANATEGGRKMLDMAAAMSEINKASHAIGSVMKVIDEIAFQTNILALNAAVEAARAGVHGKGFAVVADEVRNLATKSGEAANDSNAMIADTISKSDMGTRIVDEAIAFFKTIEEGIANISNLLDEIAKATKSQSFAIEQVNNSLTDMANVVYHNSSTSEQGAAASEQMSSQTTLLKEAVNRFLLYDGKVSGSVSFASPGMNAPRQESKQEQEQESKPEQEQEPKLRQEPEPKPGPVLPLFNAPPFVTEAPVFEPEKTPQENGDRSPSEIYAEALEREVRESARPLVPAPMQTAMPMPPTMSPDTGDGFKDDESKY